MLHMDTRRVDVLDGVRVVCVFLVAWFHVWQQSWLTPSIEIGSIRISLDFVVRSGYIFVDGLILLSGFLLFLPYARNAAEGKPLPSVRGFFERRVMRIVPSYYLSILIMLIFVAIPQSRYASIGAMLKDLGMHATFTHTLSPDTYLHTPLNGALWTLGVEVQAYLFFPLLARAFLKKPALTYLGMAGTAFLFRGIVMRYVADTSMWFNQLPAFLDVYANGMLAALLFVKLASWKKQPELLVKTVATLLAAAAFYGIIILMQRQASASGYDGIRQSQMLQRFPLTAVMAVLMLSLAFSFRGVQAVFGNKGMQFLAGISFNYYIWHQVLAVWLKEWRIPGYLAEFPNQAGEQPWQLLYTLLCFGLAFVLAAVMTYGVEKPAAALLHRVFDRRKKTHERSTNGTIGA